MSLPSIASACAPSRAAPPTETAVPPTVARVAFVVHTFDTGGLEHCIADLCRTLPVERFRPEIVCLNRSGSAVRRLGNRDVPIHELGKRPGQDWRVVPRLGRLFRQRGYDLVHSHNWGTLLETVLACRLGGVRRHVHAEHGLEMSDLRRRGWKRFLKDRVAGWALRRTHATVGISTPIAERLRRACGTAVPVRTIDNGVDLPPGAELPAARREIRERLAIPADGVLIGSVGRLAEIKNFPLLVEAFAELAPEFPAARLAIVGGGPERERLVDRIRDLGLQDKVHAVGPRDDVGAWLKACDVYVNCSLGEGLCLAILEALACGLPAVVADVGESRRVVNDFTAPHANFTAETPRCGTAFEAGSRSALVAALRPLLANAALRERLGAAARIRYERDFTTARMTANYRELYERLLTGTPLENSFGA